MVSAIIVAYRTPVETTAAIASLRAQDRPPEEIIVVDNGAPEGAPLDGMLRRRDVRVAATTRNVGFGAGCNVGARAASGDRFLMMNADVVLTQQAVRTLADRLDGGGDTAVVGPRIISNGRVQPSARSFPSLRTGLLGRRSIGTRLLLRTGRLPTELIPTQGRFGRVDWVSGACMMIRADAFRAVGGFDSDYWMYWEDADLCRRLGYAGWKVVYEPAAVVHHATGASGTSERTIRAFHDSAARFASRHIATTSFEGRLIEAILRARTAIVLRAWANRRHRSRR